MKNLKRKILCTASCLFLTCAIAQANFADHYNAAQQYLSQYQYSSAIMEFKMALKINYMDDSARIGLVNSYLARGTYLANKEKNWLSAANDYRAAIFYLKYYPSSQDVQNSMQAIVSSTQNLNQCLAMAKFNTSPKNRFNTGKELRYEGLFPEAGYEFEQSLTDPALRKGAYEQIADIMNVLNNTPKSSEYYQKALALGQDDPLLRLKYARILDKQGKNDQAVQEYNYALANGSDDPEILYSLERMYRQKLDQNSSDAATLTNLGAVLQKEEKYDEALKYYNQASQLDPTNVTTRLNVGTLYQQKKSYDSAIAAYDSILFLNPNNIQANLYKAQCLAASNQNDKALDIYNKVLSLDPSNKQAKNEIFDILKSTKAPAEVVAYAMKNCANNKNAIDDLYDYAVSLHRQNKFDEAVAYYSEILKVKKDNPEIYLNLAIAFEQKKDNESAKKVLLEAKTRFPNNKQISDNLQSINQEAVAGQFDDAAKLYSSGDYQKAMSLYQSVQPPTYDSLSGIAACYKGLKQDAQAIEFYKKAFNIKPNSDMAYYIGALYSEQENWYSSKVFLLKALSLNPNNAKAKDLLSSVSQQLNVKLVDQGIDLYEKNEYTKALDIFTKVLQSDPKNAYAYYYKGLISDAGKKYALAIPDYLKAIKFDSKLNVVYYLLAIDYDSLSQFKNALLYYKKYVATTAEENEYKKYSQERIKELKQYE